MLHRAKSLVFHRHSAADMHGKTHFALPSSSTSHSSFPTGKSDMGRTAARTRPEKDPVVLAYMCASDSFVYDLPRPSVFNVLVGPPETKRHATWYDTCPPHASSVGARRSSLSGRAWRSMAVATDPHRFLSRTLPCTTLDRAARLTCSYPVHHSLARL